MIRVRPGWYGEMDTASTPPPDRGGPGPAPPAGLVRRSSPCRPTPGGPVGVKGPVGGPVGFGPVGVKRCSRLFPPGRSSAVPPVRARGHPGRGRRGEGCGGPGRSRGPGGADGRDGHITIHAGASGASGSSSLACRLAIPPRPPSGTTWAALSGMRPAGRSGSDRAGPEASLADPADPFRPPVHREGPPRTGVIARARCGRMETSDWGPSSMSNPERAGVIMIKAIHAIWKDGQIVPTQPVDWPRGPHWRSSRSRDRS